jgi:aspartyl-tRNA synthetase
MRFSRAFSSHPTGRFMHRYRSHTCGALRDSDIGKEVRLSGWCHRIRDRGGVLFIERRPTAALL